MKDRPAKTARMRISTSTGVQPEITQAIGCHHAAADTTPTLAGLTVSSLTRAGGVDQRAPSRDAGDTTTSARGPARDLSLARIEQAAAELLATELLTARQAAGRLGMGQGRFFELMTQLRAAGLEVVTVPSRSGASLTKRYTASSINRMIRAAVRTEQPIC